jgi:hypothetical protein
MYTHDSRHSENVSKRNHSERRRGLFLQRRSDNQKTVCDLRDRNRCRFRSPLVWMTAVIGLIRIILFSLSLISEQWVYQVRLIHFRMTITTNHENEVSRRRRVLVIVIKRILMYRPISVSEQFARHLHRVNEQKVIQKFWRWVEKGITKEMSQWYKYTRYYKVIRWCHDLQSKWQVKVGERKATDAFEVIRSEE